MTREVEAIYENGVLKPVEPLPLAEKQRVKVKVTDAAEAKELPNARRAEMAWIGENAHHYKGQWVALDGSQLVSHGHNANAVRADAIAKGVDDPLMYHVPEFLGEPSIEWF
jgi:predicted DNA-binding antitoxin AbrB/MazE fold protein